MKQREDTIRKWFSLWLDSREAELSDLFTEDAAYIESWGPEYYARAPSNKWPPVRMPPPTPVPRVTPITSV